MAGCLPVRHHACEPPRDAPYSAHANLMRRSFDHRPALSPEVCLNEGETMAAYRCFAKFRYIPTAPARAQFGQRLEAIAGEAFRAIALSAKGFEIAHLQFQSDRDVVAVSSRIRSSGEIEIEIDFGNRTLPTVVFSEHELRKFDRHTAKKNSPSTPKRPTGTMFHLSR